jgi:hypothetical protein
VPEALPVWQAPARQAGEAAGSRAATPAHFPDLPTLPRFAPGFQRGRCIDGAGGRRNMIEKINVDARKVLALDEVKEKFAALGPIRGAHQRDRDYIRREQDLWSPLVRQVVTRQSEREAARADDRPWAADLARLEHISRAQNSQVTEILPSRPCRRGHPGQFSAWLDIAARVNEHCATIRRLWNTRTPRS